MDCLVTKLKGVVNDSSLLRMDELRVKFDMGYESPKESGKQHYYIYLSVRGSFSVTVIGNGYIGFTDSTVTSKTIEANSGDTYSSANFFITDDVEELRISNKYNLSYISFKFCRTVKLNVEDLYYLKYLRGLEIYSYGVTGDVSGLFKNSNLEESQGASLIVLNKSRDSSIESDVYGDVTELLKRIERNPHGISFIALNAPNITGTIHVVAENYSLGNSCGDITLDLSELDFSGKVVRVSKSNSAYGFKIIGDITSLKSTNRIDEFTVICDVPSELKGDITDIMNGRFNNSLLKFGNIKMTTVQDMSKFNCASLRCLSNQHATDDWHIDWTWTKSGYQGQYIIATENVYMQSHTEDMLVDMATKEVSPNDTESYMKAIKINALDLSSATENILEAIETLSEKGITVSINYLKAANSAMLLKAKAASKYGIVYKGKDLIVEPTDISKATISAAYDCTYKEFGTYDEAKAYVDAHGLNYIQSE